MTYLTNLGLTLGIILLAACSNTPSRYHVQQDFTPTERPDPVLLQETTPISGQLSRRGNPTSYEVFGQRYTPQSVPVGSKQQGIASWYGMKFHGHETSNGEIYDVYQLTAAHKTLPLPSYVKVTRDDNQQSVVVRVNDRGPFHHGRIIDLSYAAAIKLGIDQLGTAPVTIEVLTKPKASTEHYLQVIALSKLDQITKVKSELLQLLGPTHTVTVLPLISQGALLHKVIIGPFIDSQMTQKVKQKIMSRTQYQPIIIYSLGEKKVK